MSGGDVGEGSRCFWPEIRRGGGGGGVADGGDSRRERTNEGQGQGILILDRIGDTDSCAQSSASSPLSDLSVRVSCPFRLRALRWCHLRSDSGDLSPSRPRVSARSQARRLWAAWPTPPGLNFYCRWRLVDSPNCCVSSIKPRSERVNIYRF